MKKLPYLALLIGINAHAAYLDNNDIWTKGVITIDASSLTFEQRIEVNKGIDLFQRLTPVRVLNYTNDKQYPYQMCGTSGCTTSYKKLILKYGQCREGNLRYSPYLDTYIEVGPGCLTPGYVSGLLGKVIGLRGEQQRPDRDTSVQHFPANVNTEDPGTISSNKIGETTFKILGQFMNGITGSSLPSAIITYFYKVGVWRDPLQLARDQFTIGGGVAFGNYDYCSFTHLGATSFNSDNKITLQPLKPVSCYVYNDSGTLQHVTYIGQRDGLSQGDVAALNYKYSKFPSNRPIIYLANKNYQKISDGYRFTVSSAGSHAVSGYLASTSWTINHTPTCLASANIGYGMCNPNLGAAGYSRIREISRTPTEITFDLVSDKYYPVSVSFSATDNLGVSFSDVIDPNRL